ncbi:hypothetical protein AB0J38_41445 [Streptomyces sp. NPDC050095]
MDGCWGRPPGGSASDADFWAGERTRSDVETDLFGTGNGTGTGTV